MFIKYLTNLIPPKKSRGKGSKGKKTTKESHETVNVSEESEPEPTKKKTYSKRKDKKKVTLSADDNIISNDPDVALELAKSISQTKAEEAEAARKVHATHARIMIESVPESAKKKSGGRSSKSVVIQDTLSTPKSKPATSKTKLKGDPSITPQEQEATNIMQALKESNKTSRDNQVLEAQMKELVVNQGGSDEENYITGEKVILEWGDEQDCEFSNDDNDDVEKDDKDGDAYDEGDDHVSDTQDAGDEDDENESDEDEIYKYKIRVRKDEDAAKEEAEKTSKAKDDAKKTELPPSSSSLFVSSGFWDQFFKLSSDSSLVSTVKDSADTYKVSILVIPETTNLSPILEVVTGTPVSSAVPSPQVTPIILTVQQTPTPIPTPPITTDAPTIITTIIESKALFAVELRVAKLKKEHLSELTKKPTPIAEQESEKSPLEILKIKKEQAKKNPANHRLYHALIEALIEDENAMDKGVTDTVKDHKRKHDDDEHPPAGPNQGKKTKRRRTKESRSSKKPSTTKQTPKGETPTIGSKTSKFALTKEPVEKPIAEVIVDDAGDDVVHDDDQPQDTLEPKTRKTLNLV
uniref:Uncharacterized protein n=1 Tax=Tanacetum cinerariifolium TaxID=118510 RepID=A0A699ICX2_TANCI|nr:hypothetical protein [Tanacetum cinerariifolium]